MIFLAPPPEVTTILCFVLFLAAGAGDVLVARRFSVAGPERCGAGPAFWTVYLCVAAIVLIALLGLRESAPAVALSIALVGALLNGILGCFATWKPAARSRLRIRAGRRRLSGASLSPRRIRTHIEFLNRA